METIWLQRSGLNVPWGFRLQGGREFAQPLSVQRVTPGSVASSGIEAGDVILKIGNLNSTGLAHVEAQELIKGAGNILQLTIKKGAAPVYSPQTETPSQLSYDDRTAFTPIKDDSRAFSPLQNQVFSPTRMSKQPFSPTKTPSGAFSPVSNQTARPFSPQYNSSPTPYGLPRQDSRGSYQSPPTTGRPQISETSYNTQTTPQSVYRPTYGSQTSNHATYGADTSDRYSARNTAGNYQSQSGAPSVTPSYNDSSNYSSYTSPSRSPYTSSGYQSDNIRQQPADTSYRSQDSMQNDIYGRQTSNSDVYEPYKMSEQYRNYQQPSSDQYSSYRPQTTPSSQYDSYRSPSSQYDSQRSPPSEHSDPYSRQYSGQYDSYTPKSDQYRSPPQQSRYDEHGQPSYNTYQPSSYSQQASVRSPQPADSYQPYSAQTGGSQRNSGFTDALSDFSSTFDSMHTPSYSTNDRDTRHPDVSYDRQYSDPRKSDYTDYPSGGSGYAPAPPPAAPAPPPPPPPPPAPPPPPPDWKPDALFTKSPNGDSFNDKPEDESGEKKLPDCIANTMNKKGTAKPFAYIPGGVDLKEMREKRRQRMRPSDSQKNYQTMPASMKNKEKRDLPQQRSISPPSGGSENYSKYMSPYSKEQMQMTCTSGVSGPSKDNVDAVNSEVLKLIQENDARGRRGSGGNDPNKQSASFRILQKMTDTDAADENEDVQPNNSRRQKKLLRHNSDDDEMRFSGLHPVSEIPSKSFQRIKKLSHADQDDNKVSDNDEQVGKYDETSIRYKGKFIPSPSFRVLQTWAELDPDKNTTTDTGRSNYQDDDDLPETLDPDECRDVRYTGGNIPSKVFKKLQLSVGEDPSASGSDTNEAQENASKPKPARSIKVMSRAKPATTTAEKEDPPPPPGLTTGGATDF